MQRLAVVALCLLALVACQRDRYETGYDDFVTARQQDAVDRGWIPEFLPEEATDLREAHTPATDDALVVATLPGGILPDVCRTVDDVDMPALDAPWAPPPEMGQPVRCGGWEGRLDGTTLLLWNDGTTVDGGGAVDDGTGTSTEETSS